MDKSLQKKFNLIKWIGIVVIIALLVYFGNNLTYDHFVQLFQESPIYLVMYLISWAFFLLFVYLYEKFFKSLPY